MDVKRCNFSYCKNLNIALFLTIFMQNLQKNDKNHSESEFADSFFAYFSRSSFNKAQSLALKAFKAYNGYAIDLP